MTAAPRGSPARSATTGTAVAAAASGRIAARSRSHCFSASAGPPAPSEKRGSSSRKPADPTLALTRRRAAAPPPPPRFGPGRETCQASYSWKRRSAAVTPAAASTCAIGLPPLFPSPLSGLIPENSDGPDSKRKRPPLPPPGAAAPRRVHECAAPPTSECASRTRTRRPYFESRAAHERPPRPEPIMTASKGEEEERVDVGVGDGDDDATATDGDDGRTTFDRRFDLAPRAVGRPPGGDCPMHAPRDTVRIVSWPGSYQKSRGEKSREPPRFLWSDCESCIL